MSLPPCCALTSAQAAQNSIGCGQNRLCCRAALQLCLQARELGALQGDRPLCRSLHHRAWARSLPWGDVERRGCRGAHGEEPKEGCEPQLSAHQSNQ